MNSNYKPLKSRLRATFAAGATNEPRLERVDREALALHGVQITLEGEALGHGVWLDRQFCQDVVDAGNAMGDAGVKVRFGHPSMCSDALGTYLGRAKNFRLVDLTRKDGTAAAGVLADVYLDPNADRTEWVMNMAESAPDTFGQSIVFTYADTKYVDANGVWHKMSEDGATLDNSADGKEYAILGKLHGTDFTDTPAATDGVFSADDLAAEAAEMMEQHPELSKVQGKNVIEFLKRMGREDILDAFENARVSGLQKAQAAEKSDWETKMTKLAEERDALQAKFDEFQKRSVEALAAAEAAQQDLVAKHAEELLAKDDELKEQQILLAGAVAEVEALKVELNAKTVDLGALKGELDATVKALSESEDALTAKSAALEESEARYRAQVGKALVRNAGDSAWAAKYREVRQHKKSSQK